MPTDWQTHADGVGTAVSTAHRLDGSLTSVTVEMDTFRVREWDAAEVENSGKSTQDLFWDERDETYDEHADGAHAVIKFDVNDGVATLRSIQPAGGDPLRPRHIRILPGAVRVVRLVPGVGTCNDPLETLASAYHDAGDVFIDALDAE